MIIHRKVKSMLPVIGTKDRRTALTKLYVSDEEAVATDGHVLVRMPVDKDLTADDMPKYPGKPITEPTLIDPDVIKKAVDNTPKKPTLEALEYINITKDGDKLFTNLGLPVVSFPSLSCEESYPNYKVAIPDYTDQSPLKFALDGKLLKKLCDLAAKHGNGITHRITFEIPTTESKPKTDEKGEPVFDGGELVFEDHPIESLTTALKFTIKADNGDLAFHGIIMPLREKQDAIK